jgi:hypothetical protein
MEGSLQKVVFLGAVSINLVDDFEAVGGNHQIVVLPPFLQILGVGIQDVLGAMTAFVFLVGGFAFVEVAEIVGGEGQFGVVDFGVLGVGVQLFGFGVGSGDDFQISKEH